MQSVPKLPDKALPPMPSVCGQIRPPLLLDRRVRRGAEPPSILVDALLNDPRVPNHLLLCKNLFVSQKAVTGFWANEDSSIQWTFFSICVILFFSILFTVNQLSLMKGVPAGVSYVLGDDQFFDLGEHEV